MTDSSVTGRNQNQNDVRDESARDNDPLFELSRIFGFEEPAGQTNAQNPQAETENFSEISLERELMADFDAELATEFAAEPELNLESSGQFSPALAGENYQNVQNDSYAPVQAQQQQGENPYMQQAAEPRFTGYAPQQRAYAENQVEVVAARDDSGDAYYEAYSDLPQDAAFAESQQQDNTHAFSALTDTDNANYSDEPETPAAQHYEPRYSGYDVNTQAVQGYSEQTFDLPDLELPDLELPELDLNDLAFEEVGREPQSDFSAHTFDELSLPALQQYHAEDAPQHYETQPAQQHYETQPAQQPAAAALSLEDELAFLLHDEVPSPAYQAPEPASTDFAPMFDAPELAPVATTYDQPHDAPVYSGAQIDDEFFAAPDLTHLPNRTSSYSYQEEAAEAEIQPEPAAVVNSFADLFGASSQVAKPAEENNDFGAYSEPLTYDSPVAAQSHVAPETEDFDFGDDFYIADNDSSHSGNSDDGLIHGGASDDLTFSPSASANVSQTVSHNAVRGFSSYVFGAATSPSAPVEPSADAYAPAEYQPVSESYTYEEEPVVATDDFFSNDDFDFSLTDDVPAAGVDEFAERAAMPEVPDYQPATTFSPKPSVPAPEVEAVIVAENKVEQTQAFDLPDVSFGDDAKQTGLNSLESEFAEIFSTISVSEATLPDSTSEADKAFENILQDNFADYHASVKADAEQAAATKSGFGAGAAIAGAAVAGASAARGAAPQADATKATQDDYYNHWAAQGAQNNDFDTYNIGETFARDEQDFADYSPREEHPLRKPALWASVAAAAVIVLGGGYYLLKSGGVVGGEPVVIRADKQPVKMQPENPGGAVVPNQDKAVYDQVSGTKPAAPEQKTLINTEEVPVDVGLLQGQDAEEDRVFAEEANNADGNSQSGSGGQNELITPRTVKTMVVRADGTIVESTAPAATAPQAAAPVTDSGLDEASRLISQSAVPERLGTDKPVASAQSAAAPRVVQTQTFTASGEQAKPREVAPVAPTRPVEQPQAAQQVASAPAASAAAPSANVPAGTWFIQVASQPSAELAQKNYANLTSRYGTLLGGRGVDIKKADIAGKGTYYRVRIPAGSKAEAGALCERLKAAGGNCFPTL
ncbi:SPOR domain-containing protein [Pseudochrobactrum sp. MP213Fo]|uniref:SPOR domain-containing protein n=1 Tax=Pseudochrobactrum sp. MP213Fo TaxID=3022250 RepID=UPI003B9E2811